MQLEKVVMYHKAMADPTRLRMLVLIASGELNGQVLADQLGVTPATVTHHVGKLREASLIRERRDKNTVYFSLDHNWLQVCLEATGKLIYRARQEEEQLEEYVLDKHQKFKQSVLRNFFTAEGRLKHVPVQLKKKLVVLEELVSKLEKGRSYTEKEINEFIQRFHEDYATIRREFIMHQYMYREHQVYELNPPELWAHWETLK